MQMGPGSMTFEFAGSDEGTSIVSGLHPRTVEMEFAITPMNRPAVEIMFGGLCIKCGLLWRNCDCHERGYN